MFRNITYGIYNLIFFFKVIWNFRSWDHVYALRVYQKCLRHTLNKVEKYCYYDSKDDMVNVLKRVIEILESRNSDDYITRAEKDLGMKLECNFFKKEINNKIFIEDGNTEEQNKINSQILELAIKFETEEWKELRSLMFGNSKIKESDCRGWGY